MDKRPSGAASSSAEGRHSQHRHHNAHHQQQRRSHHERGADLICRVKYANTLPDLPFEPKFLQSPFISLSRFINYKSSTLEKNFKYELLTEPDLNVKIDLIDPMTYYCDPMDKPALDPVDEQLLEDENLSQLNSRRSIQHRKIVPWMRKTEYISTEFSRYGIGQMGAERPDTKIGYGTKKLTKDEQFEYKDREDQIAAIQRTFAEAQKPVKRHYSKSGVTAVEEIPILPDFKIWKFQFAQVIFDSDPLPYCKEFRDQKLKESLLKGLTDSKGNQFVGYFAPTDDTLEQRIADDNEEFGSYRIGTEYQYKLEREYSWTVHMQENYFLIRRGNTFSYNRLRTKVKLTRRPKIAQKNTVMMLTHREPKEEENPEEENE